MNKATVNLKTDLKQKLEHHVCQDPSVNRKVYAALLSTLLSEPSTNS